MRDRALGVFVLAEAAILMLWFALMPAKLSVLGTDVSCSMPAVRVAVGSSDAVPSARGLAEMCVAESLPRLIFAGAVAVIGIIAGMALLRPRRY